jgi:hypothetical protein
MYSGKGNMNDLEETQHPCFQLPTNKDIPIWRYMDLGKYLSMLDRGCLYFARATTLDDPFEGAPTRLMVALREHIRANRATDPALASYKDVPDGALNWGAIFQSTVRQHFVNCWHMNEHESAAMWKLYSSSSEAVCIQSTYRRLRICLPQCVMMGEIKYIDYETQGFPVDNGFYAITHKRSSFSHERELRAIFWELSGEEDAQRYKSRIEAGGLAIEVSLSALIERVCVSPTAPSWFATLVGTMTERCGFKFPVDHSALAARPLF